MKSPSRLAALRWIFALTTLLSAFLLFEVQPILSKFILPWFGGTPSVWTTCMVFFQSVLFLGYAYAHLSQRMLSARAQAIVHLVLLAAAVALLPIAPDLAWKPLGGQSPTVQILLLLAVCAGLPYLAISATGPLLQAWFSHTYPDRSPYRLYALSNVGSLLALVSYPFLVEPALAVKDQANYWTWGFVVFAALCAASAIVAGWLASTSTATPARADQPTASAAVAAPALRERLTWLLLPALASLMLLATTNHVCQDVAVIPFLWLMPLSLYLLTFIISFDHERWYRPTWVALAAVVTLGLVVSIDQLIATGAGVSVSYVLELVLCFAALFFLCFLCHGELARRKPAPRYLTSFYLYISAGGALGGMFVSLAAPQIFSSFLEWKLGLIAGSILAAAIILGGQSQASLRRLYYLAPALVLLFAGFHYLPHLKANQQAEVNVSSRSFYGVARVIEQDSNEPALHRMQLYSGHIVHGLQFADARKRLEPNTYFGRESGVGRAFEFYNTQPEFRAAVVGLGAGTMAAYAKSGQHFRFYEINPEMHRLAKTYFSYLDDCQGQVEVVLGDGRLSLEREAAAGSSDPPYDLLVLDAFSGDSVPAHLLTKEAFGIYTARLLAGGSIAVNISNRYLDLDPVVRGVGEQFGLTTLRFSSAGNPADGTYPAEWIVLTSNPALLARYAEAAEHRPTTCQPRSPFWTDDFSNLFEILK